MSNFRKAHLFVGVAGLCAFLLTGQYMHWAMHHLQHLSAGPRLFLRSVHIYLMWSSLLNLVLAYSFVRSGCIQAFLAQCLASIAIALGPLLLVTSFFAEPFNLALARPLGNIAMLLAFGGTIVHAIIGLSSGRPCRNA